MSKPTLFGRSGRLAAAVAIAAGVGLQAADVTVSGVLKRQYYPGGTRATVAAGSATLASTTAITSGEAPRDVADNYAQRLSGWFKPTTSGKYSFVSRPTTMPTSTSARTRPRPTSAWLPSRPRGVTPSNGPLLKAASPMEPV